MMIEDRNDRSISIPTTPISRSLTKSTPRALTVKPPALKLRSRNQTEDDISVQSLTQGNDISVETEDPFLIPVTQSVEQSQCPKSHLENLPPEILEGIVGHIVGHLGSAASDPSGPHHAIRNWNAVMRHPRRKKLADMAIVSYTWRRLIQERIYRHIKIQGTKAALEECGDWFLKNAHLQAYVRHFEVLVPIWEMRNGRIQPRFTMEPRPDGQTTLFRNFQGLTIGSDWTGEVQEATAAFQLASKNAALDEIFGCAQVLFPFLCALTIEGGHCKRPPKVRYFREEERTDPPPNPFLKEFILPPYLESAVNSRNLTLSLPEFYMPPGDPQLLTTQHSNTIFLPPPPPHKQSQLSALPNTKTLILKGAWNIIRSPADFSTLASALPFLREFHCTYHKPKTGAYKAICDSLKYGFPSTITHLNLCLEGLYTKNASSLKKWRKLYPEYHMCRNIGAVAPQLESLTYTGRVCSALFSTAVKAADESRGGCTRLKSIDVVVNNVCRDPCSHNDGTGIHNWPFIQAFEALVLQAVRSLQTYTAIKNIRIRFIDLDSPAPLLNPTFHLEGDKAWGFWSDEILRILREARPQVQFGITSRMTTDEESVNLVNEFSEAGKYRSMNIGYYRAMAQAGAFGL